MMMALHWQDHRIPLVLQLSVRPSVSLASTRPVYSVTVYVLALKL